MAEAPKRDDSVRIDLLAGDQAALVGMARSAGGNLYHVSPIFAPGGGVG